MHSRNMIHSVWKWFPLETIFFKNMPRSQEKIEYQSDGEGYKKLSELFGVHVSLLWQIIYRWKSLCMTTSQSRCGHFWKITARSIKHLVQQAQTYPNVTSAIVQASPGIVVSMSIHLYWDEFWRMSNGRMTRIKLLLTEKHKQARLNNAKAHMYQWEMFCQKFLWSDDTKL